MNKRYKIKFLSKEFIKNISKKMMKYYILGLLRLTK